MRRLVDTRPSGFAWDEDERAELERRIELLGRHWTIGGRTGYVPGAT